MVDNGGDREIGTTVPCIIPFDIQLLYVSDMGLFYRTVHGDRPLVKAVSNSSEEAQVRIRPLLVSVEFYLKSQVVNAFSPCHYQTVKVKRKRAPNVKLHATARSHVRPDSD